MLQDKLHVFCYPFFCTFRSNEATAARTSLKKWICVLSTFIVIIPTHLLGQMWANPPEPEFEVTKKGKEMYKKSVIHVRSFCFAYLTCWFFDGLFAVRVYQLLWRGIWNYPYYPAVLAWITLKFEIHLSYQCCSRSKYFWNHIFGEDGALLAERRDVTLKWNPRKGFMIKRNRTLLKVYCCLHGKGWSLLAKMASK